MINNTLYAKYLSERQGCKVLENDNGFIIYKITMGECFIVDMFVDETKRNKSLGRSLVQELESIAKDNECSVISANVHLCDSGHTNTLQAAFKVGFKIIKAEQNILILIKEIGGK